MHEAFRDRLVAKQDSPSQQDSVRIVENATSGTRYKCEYCAEMYAGALRVWITV